MITKKMLDARKKSPYDREGEYGGTAAPSEHTLKKIAKRKKGHPLLNDLCTLPNEEVLDPKTTEILELSQIIYDSIIGHLRGKTRYSPIEFEAGVRWFASEGIKTLPQEKLNKFYEHTPEDLVGYLPTEIIDAIYLTKPHNITIQEPSPSIDTGYGTQTVLTNSSNPKNLEHKINIFGRLTLPKADTIKNARIREPNNSKKKPIDYKKALIRHRKQ